MVHFGLSNSFGGPNVGGLNLSLPIEGDKSQLGCVVVDDVRHRSVQDERGIGPSLALLVDQMARVTDLSL